MSYSERFQDLSVVQLDVSGFEHLTLKQKKLVHYLSEAGLWGQFISLDQKSAISHRLMKSMISLYENSTNQELTDKLKGCLFLLFAHGGIYHNTTGEKLSLPITLDDLNALRTEQVEIEDALVVEMLLFSPTSEERVKKIRTVQTEGVDVVAESGVNFYHGLTTAEVEEFRKKDHPQHDDDKIPPYGFNERLVKSHMDSGIVTKQVIRRNGLYSKYVEKIIENLEKALPYTENEAQKLSISTLIHFYKTGKAQDFDDHCVAWVKDNKSSIYFINGLIESYKDPLGVACSFESIVAFKDPLETEKVEKIIKNIQWFEDNLPFNSMFKKKKAVGLSASSINVISMAGETSPILPLGINLPNSDWIRKYHGSKSVTLSNVDTSRSHLDGLLQKALYLEEYQEIMSKYGKDMGVLHTDLHEIAGHGSGEVLSGVNTDVLSKYYSVIEECRADLVALYYMADEKLKEFGIYKDDVNVKDAALAKYVAYITNGAIGQLRRIKLGSQLTQAHFRNRQVIATWLLEKADKSKMSMVKVNNEHHIKINDVDYVRDLIGKLLAEVQRIKSEGDFNAAKDLVINYGTSVNLEIHEEILSRVEKLDLPNLTCFMTPIISIVGEDVVITQYEDFVNQQIELFKKYTE